MAPIILIDTIVEPATRADEIVALKKLIAQSNNIATTVNQLITAYTALAAELNVDTGVASTDYGTGSETPPNPIV